MQKSKMIVKISQDYDEDGGSQEMSATYKEKTIKISQSSGSWMEPEDCCFGRDLNEPTDYYKFIQMAHECGKNGDDLEVIYLDKE